MRLLLFSLVLLSIASCSASRKAAPETFASLEDLVDQYAEQAISKGNINALAVGIYAHGKTYHNYYGSLDQGRSSKPHDSTLFELASLSKVFTGTLVAKAVVEQRLALTADVRQYLDGDYSSLAYREAPIQIKHLVTHTLGIDQPKRFAEVYKEMFAGAYRERAISYTMDSLLLELQEATFQYKPGTHYAYNNLGPELAALALEKAYGQSYQSLLYQLFEELGMSQSQLYDPSSPPAHLANSFTDRNELAPVIQNPFLGGAGGVVATLPDLMAFVQYQLKSGSAVVEESRQYLHRDGEDDTAYFWDLGEGQREGFYYYKRGSTSGTETALILCPDSDYGLVMIMNNQSEAAEADFGGLAYRLEEDLILYPKLNLWSTVASEFEESPATASASYLRHRKDRRSYFASSSQLNDVGYQYINQGKLDLAIQVFQLAITADPKNANLYDSLGEAYFLSKDYGLAKVNFSKSLSLNPNNANAKTYLEKIEHL